MDNIVNIGSIDLPMDNKNLATPPPNSKRLINRNLSSEELKQWYSASTVIDRINWAIRKGIVYLDANGKFNKRNFEPRTLDEMPVGRRASIHYRDKSCAYCGSDKDLQVDHVIPFMAWPEELLWLANTSSNLVSACADCNKNKSYKYSDLAFKFPYPIVGFCKSCSRFKHKSCDKVLVHCTKCQDVSAGSVCQLHGVDCEEEN
jgi:hypothetical protein